MSGIVVLVFDDPYKAHEARAAILRLTGEGYLQLDETAVAIKRDDGNVQVFQDVDVLAKRRDQGHWVGIAAALLTGVQPLILLGTGAGAAVDRFTDSGVTRQFIRRINGALLPGTSALFIQGDRTGDLNSLDPVFRERLLPFGGRILRTTIPDDVERLLQEAVAAPA